MNTDATNHRILHPLMGLLSAIMVVAGVAGAPDARAADPLTPMAHTIDYVVVSSSPHADFLSTADLQDRTDKVSQAWNRMSRGVITGMTMDRVATLPNFTGSFCNAGVDEWNQFYQAIGRPASYYTAYEGHHLVVVATVPDTDGCTFDGRNSSPIRYGNLSAGGMLLLVSRPQQAPWNPAVSDPMAIAHEMGHMFGLYDAQAVTQACADSYWDGPFLGVSTSRPDVCTNGDAVSNYGDDANIMGANWRGFFKLDINGPQKAKMGLIQPGAGLQDITAGPQEQLITLNDSRTTDRSALQSLRLTSDDPDGPGPCGPSVYQIDYDPTWGGVRVFRLPAGGECSGGIVGSQIAWSVPTSYTSYRTFFLPGESRLTWDGKIQIKFVSADSAAGTATVSIRRTDVPGFATLQLNSRSVGGDNKIQAGSSGGQVPVTVTTNQGQWSAQSDQSWVTVSASGTSGQAISVATAPNPAAQDRTAVVTVRAGNATTTLTVVQQAGPSADDCGASNGWTCVWADVSSPARGTIEAADDVDWFRFTPVTKGSWSFTVSGSGGSAPAATLLLPSSNGVPCLDDNKQPCKDMFVAPDQGRITANLDGGKSYYIQVSGGNGTSDYTITATAPVPQISVPQTNWAPAPEGDTLRLTVTSNTLWRLGGLPDWLHPDYTTGYADKAMVLVADRNLTGQTRSATVTFGGAGQEVSLSVTQDPALGGTVDCAAPSTCQIQVTPAQSGNPESWTLPGSGGTKVYQVASNAPWQLAVTDQNVPVDWVTASPGSGSGFTTVTLTVPPNPTRQGRNAHAVFSVPGSSQLVYIYQAPADDCGSTASTACEWADLGTPASGAIEWTNDKDWFKITPAVTGSWSFASSPAASDGLRDAYGTLYAADGTTVLTQDDNSAGNGQFQMTALLTAGQTYFLEVRSGNEDRGGYTVTATPPVAPTLSLSQTQWAPGPSPVTIWVQVKAAGMWTLSVPDWVWTGQRIGYGDTMIGVTAVTNLSAYPRTGDVVVTSGGETATLTINQAGAPPQLLAAPLTWSAPGQGGTKKVQVAGNVSWRVDAPQEVGVDVRSGTNNGFVTLTLGPNNTDYQRNLSVTISGEGIYLVVTISQPPSYGDDCGTTVATACTWGNMGSPVRGSVEKPWDFDMFTFTPDTTGTWTFTSSAPPVNPLFNPLGFVLSADAERMLAVNQGGAGNYQFRMSAYLVAGQTYQLAISANSPYLGDYVVTATRP